MSVLRTLGQPPDFHLKVSAIDFPDVERTASEIQSENCLKVLPFQIGKLAVVRGTTHRIEREDGQKFPVPLFLELEAGAYERRARSVV